MAKHINEIRDPIHVFIHFSDDERRVIDSTPFQRLRHIHQLALTFLVYPGASHKRFEHSLGVMELASRVYDVVLPHLREYAPDNSQDTIAYWRRILRLAALCHDIGHLPFSHAAEKELLPEGWSHERMTRQIILSPEMSVIWKGMENAPNLEEIVKLALGKKKAPDLNFGVWESLLAEIITGDAFGVDRIDYLLRDSYYTGVTSGRFDHYRLIDTLRVLKQPPTDEGQQSDEPGFGVEKGGLHAAEGLPLARYFMFSQVYCHPVRRIYDIHLRDFLSEWLHGNKFPIQVEEYLKVTDNEVMAGMLRAATNPGEPGHQHATRIVQRRHFRRLYSVIPDDFERNPHVAEVIYNAVKDEFGVENVRFDSYPPQNPEPDFSVLAEDGRIISARSASQVIQHVPMVVTDYVFIAPELRDKAREWLDTNREKLVADSTITEETS